MRHREVNRLLTPETGSETRQSAFFFELRAHRGWRTAGTQGELLDFLVHVFRCDAQVLAAGQFVEHQCARYRTARRFRVFTAQRAGKGLERVLDVVTLPAKEVKKRLQEGRALLG